MNAQHHEHVVTAADGLSLFVRDLAPEGPERGPPALCLHGLTRNSRDFEDILPRIAAGGRRALALDVRGRGRSERDPNPTRYRLPVYAQDALRVLDALGIARAAFVGTSMGGLITMEVAGRAPERIERAVLNDIGPELDPGAMKFIFDYVRAPQPTFATWQEATDFVRGNARVVFPKAPEDFFGRMARRLFVARAPGQIVLDYDPAIGAVDRPEDYLPEDPWALWRAFGATPTLVVRGGLSTLFPAATLARMLAERPAAEAVTAADVGHAPYLDEADVWPTLARFLDLA